MSLLLYVIYIFWLKEAKCKSFNKVYTVLFFFWAQCQSGLSQKHKVFCKFYICHVHLDLETLDTIRKKKNFLLTGQTKTNVYFVTCICTLTARNDIFQRVFVVPHRTLLPARVLCTSRSAPPETRTFFEKSHPIRPPVCHPYPLSQYPFQP